MRRTLLLVLGGFLAPTIAALLILGAEDDGPRQNLDTFSNVNFPFEFKYPDDFKAASAEGKIPALSLDGSNAITVRRLEEDVPASGLSAYVAQLLVDQAAESHTERRAGLDMVSARVPREVGTGTAESLLYFFTARGGTYQIECQFTPKRGRQVVRACRRAVRTLDFTE